jgi:hypothetical protein
MAQLGRGQAELLARRLVDDRCGGGRRRRVGGGRRHRVGRVGQNAEDAAAAVRGAAVRGAQVQDAEVAVALR